MPIYDYQCEKCEHAFEMNLGMDNRNRPTTEPCPECGALSVKKTIGGMPNLGKMQDLDMLKTGKLPQHFRDSMNKVANSPGVKGTKYGNNLSNFY